MPTAPELAAAEPAAASLAPPTVVETPEGAVEAPEREGEAPEREGEVPAEPIVRQSTSSASVPPKPASREQDPVARLTHALDDLQVLADLLAVEDGYVPAVRDFALPRTFKLSIVIPVYNEVRTIRQVLAHVAALPIPKEIIVVDDASTDGTRDLLSRLDLARDVHVIFKPHNEGKGAALRTGLRRVTGDIVVIQDADLEYDPRDILLLVRPIVAGLADVVYGSRFLGHQAAAGSLLHRLGNRLLTTASNWTTGLALSDMETCYKAFRREVVRSFEIQQPRFGFEPEVTARLARRKFRICEVPISYAPRSYADGKKIGLWDVFTALYCIARYALSD